jgi:hypothetical protein
MLGCGKKGRKMPKRYTIAQVKKVFKEAACQLLEESYSGNKTPMHFRCHCGNEAHIALQDFIRGVRCGCGRMAEGAKRRHSMENVKQYFARHGCTLLEETMQTALQLCHPFGSSMWQEITAKQLGLESTFQLRGMPIKH